jgi:hypothetical protein
MSFITSGSFGLLVACGFLAVGCSSAATSESEEAESSADEVVGVADLPLLQKTLGLVADQKVNGAWSRDVTKGGCHAAYAARDATVQYRRYKNGAAFFDSRVEASREQGDERPVLCVDLDQPKLSLDGVALDAIFRFDLGKPVGTDSAPGGEVYVELERGKLHMLVTGSARGPSNAQVAALRKEHGKKLVESPTFIGGSLVDVTVRDAKVFEPFSRETHASDLVVSGSLAAFAYAAAYAKTGSAFSLSRDPLGALSVLSGAGDARKLRAEQGGDGPGWWQGLYFPIATVSEAGFYDGGMGDPGPGRMVRTFRLTGPSNPQEGYIENADLECELTTTYASENDAVGAASPITCKGL